MRRYLVAALAALPVVIAPALMISANASTEDLVAVRMAAGEKVPGQYIVTLKPGVEQQVMFDQTPDIRPMYVYDTVLNGFAARLDDQQLDELRRDPKVASIEEDQIAKVSEVQDDAPWGLDRLDQKQLPLDHKYNYTTKAEKVTAYIIDTGIEPEHDEFGGRAKIGHDSMGGDGQDCHGHGTHVAGTVGGKTYGLAKGVQLSGVRVLGCDGSGSYSGVIEGIDWVAKNAAKPAVANMSLGGGFSQAVNDASARLVQSGVFMAVAAGNSSTDACQVSPASTPEVTTVAASDTQDGSAYFTNDGKCVDVYAPGVSIVSAKLGGGETAMSGTSMAAPHVAGIAALYKGSKGDADSATLNKWMVDSALPDTIDRAPENTTSRMAQKGDL